MLVPFSRKICHCVLPRKRKINLEFRRIKRNNSFSARTVQVNKTLSGNSSFGLRENLVEPYFNVTQRINLEIQHPGYNKTNNPVELQLTLNRWLLGTDNRSANKYPSIFRCQVESIVIIILQIFFATRTFIKFGEYYSDIPRLITI